tara:strand:+ start:389 stop:1078 length:690 start_codon:yes stop_codon:yes gene_type:complete
MKFRHCALAGALAALVLPATAHAESKSLQLAKVVLDTETAPIEARVKGGTLCVFPSKIELPKEKKTQEFERYDRLMSQTLGTGDVAVVSDSDDLFAAESEDKGDILLGAVMVPTAINICSSVKGFKGTIDVKVEWQFYDRESSSVVETLTTEGSGTLLKFSNNGFDEMWDAAFVDALEKVREAGVIDRVLASDAAVVQVEATQEPGETAVDTAKDTSDMDDAAEMAPAS